MSDQPAHSDSSQEGDSGASEGDMLTPLHHVLGPFLYSNDASNSIVDYLKPGMFTGAFFEGIADPDPFRITANDIVAVSMLSVDIPAPTAAWILGEGQRHISALLRSMPTDAHLADPDVDISRNGPAWELWDLLSSGRDMGPTKTSKLMAAKRPSLIPISDSVVRAALEGQGTWSNWRAYLQSGEWKEARPGVRAAAIEAGGADLSDLRVLDIIIWMKSRPLEADVGTQ